MKGTPEAPMVASVPVTAGLVTTVPAGASVPDGSIAPSSPCLSLEIRASVSVPVYTSKRTQISCFSCH